MTFGWNEKIVVQNLQVAKKDGGMREDFPLVGSRELTPRSLLPSLPKQGTFPPASFAPFHVFPLLSLHIFHTLIQFLRHFYTFKCFKWAERHD